ncbi:hypothetical protein [Porphyrobacter sp. YT40]|uniref:hypothetical protein n=1 Tax=Porphyrobacter sp. YT40 TaxID=2547601 RepID=UPI0011438C15|nr:hypothetical protein [Porphyrobacter sp. YT40]QDH35371.1 hypothetical protein E2E27_14235 [Porphyrobacter sp. YT40]
MGRDTAMFALHACAAGFTLVAALLWPRAGEAALLVPVGGQDVASLTHFAAREGAPLLELDSGRVIARLDDRGSPLRALSEGILPLAASARGCSPLEARES